VLCQPLVVIVVATVESDVGQVRTRLAAAGVAHTRAIAPGAHRRLVLGCLADEWAAERLVADLRGEGLIVVIRPDSGARLAGWHEHTKPITFGERLSVCFAWSEHERRDLPGLIELGLGGFGNGQHPTTGMLIEELLHRIVGGERVLDVGCGSGVLGLSALRLGAAHLVAMDVSPDAVDATRRNAALNGMAHRVDATIAPLADLPGPFDVIVANVARAAIVELAPDLVRLLAPGGWLAVSGISPAQCTQVAEFLRPLEPLHRRDDGDWSALTLHRPPEHV
jgi:ribosomal protein L11 methyltransferase